MWHSRPRRASRTPGDGLIGTSTPAMRATDSDHGPVAFTTMSARSSPSVPVTWSRSAAPFTVPCSTMRSSTSMKLYRAAPWCFAVARKRSGSRIASIVASGTRTAARISGFNMRLEAEALVGAQFLDRDLALRAPAHEVVVVGHVLIGDGDEEPVVLLERARADPAQDGVLLDALDRRLLVVDGVPGSRVQQAVMASGRARGHLAALDEADAEPPQREVVREGGARATAADDQDVRSVTEWPRCGLRHHREYRTAASTAPCYESFSSPSAKDPSGWSWSVFS